MKTNKLGLIIFLLVIVFWGNYKTVAQTPSPTPELTVSKEKREQAYAKLHEAQRWMWTLERARSQAVLQNSYNSAKQALKKAVELNPNLAEAYTAMAELNLKVSPADVEEALLQAGIAAKLNPDSFGARQLLARIYTAKSQIANEALEPVAAEKAITHWKEITRLDPRNAEAWAFLSAFYEKQNKTTPRIEALRKWLSSSTPIYSDFYRRVFGKSEDLSPENASLKLGDALIKAGKTDEAIEVLSQTIADQPDNPLAIDLLRNAIQIGNFKSSGKTIELLQQAIYANPSNLVLIELLSNLQVQMGKSEDAIKTLKNSIQNSQKEDKNSVANLQVSLGDIYFQTNKFPEAIQAYEDSLTTFGIGKDVLNTDDQKEFATRVFEKLIRVLKNSGKIPEARAAIERARILLGKDDLFADKQLIALLRETNKKDEALATVRSVRKNNIEDYSLLRTEASILTELGRVEEGVLLVKALMAQKSTVPSAFYDDFSNYLFISGLYSQAKKPKEAMETAQKAFGVAQSDDRKQLANLSLAVAQQQSGNFQLAETTLRAILKQTPDNPIALNNLGYFLLERNDRISEAVKLIEQAIQIDPTNSSYLDSLGWGHYKLGNYAEAEHYLKASLRFNPSSANSFEHLGDVYLKQGNNELAKNAWQKALTFTSDPEARNRLKSKIQQKN